jgi:hypothetical protein
MPSPKVVARARRDAREGKSPSTQAGEFVREEMHHIGEQGRAPQSPEQAIAIGLSEARRAGVALPAPKKGATSERTRKQAMRDAAKGRSGGSGKMSRSRKVATRSVAHGRGRRG